MQRLSVLLMAMGAATLGFYYFSVRLGTPLDVYILFFGVLLQSTASVLALLPFMIHLGNKPSTCLFILSVVILSSSVAFSRTIRYTVPLQADNFHEYQAAVVQSQRWDPSRVGQMRVHPESGITAPISEYYLAGCLSVSILPNIIHSLMGLSILEVFEYVMPLLVAALPLIAYVLIRRYLGNGVLTHVAVMLIPQYLFFSQHLGAFRSTVALHCLFLLLFSLSLKNRTRSVLLACFAFGIVSSHYSVAYYGGITLALLLLARFVLSKLDVSSESIVGLGDLSTYVIIVGIWMTFIEFCLMYGHLLRGWDMLSLIFHPEQSLSPEMGWITSSPRSIVTTVWFDLQFALIGLAGLYYIYRLFRRKMQERLATWTILGSIAITWILQSLFVPGTSYTLIEPSRAATYAAPFLMVCLGASLLAIKGRIQLITVIYLLLMLPMTMMLDTHQMDVKYHPDSAIPPERLLLWYHGRGRGTFDFIGARYISHQVPTGKILQVDSLTFTAMIMGGRPRADLLLYKPKGEGRPPELISMEEAKNKGVTPVEYIVVHNLFLESGLWGLIVVTREWYVHESGPNALLREGNMVYHNGYLSLICEPSA